MSGWWRKKEAKSVYEPSRDIPDLTGKVIIVTGANSGLGYETAKQLYAHNAKVYLACRSEQKAKDAITRMKDELFKANLENKGELVWLDLDLNDPKKAKKAAEEFMLLEERLDVLVNNAGCTSGTYVNGPETYDIQRVMMVNHLSPFVFTLTLLPLLTRTASEPGSDVRIVNLSSGQVKSPNQRLGRLHFRNRDDFNDLHKDELAPVRGRYAMSKTANALFTTALQARFEKDGIPIIAAAVDPGLVDTEGIRNVMLPSLPKAFQMLYSLHISRTFVAPSKGAHAQLFASTAPQLRSSYIELKSPLLWIQPDCSVTKCPNQTCENLELAEELWTGSVKVLEEIGVAVQ
ncbi:NAD-P-binding protein [Cristinia sonorae]|uniref:NAD-P-binding protein n=1 Tax=Cristinia sonorae TaxID=1940300 RepID=A0A8K0XP49_9AGAR|nr:NAD-P-binding protein [Cristinia sonorae]